jgi:hypothetical protein
MKKELIKSYELAEKLRDILRNTDQTECVFSLAQYKALAGRQQLRPVFCREVEEHLEYLGLIQIKIYASDVQQRVRLFLIGNRNSIIRRLKRNVMRDSVIAEALG